MPSNMQTKYEIELQIANADRVNSTISNVERSLSDVAKSAKELDFNAALKGVEGLEAQMRELRESESDATAEMKAFGRSAERAYSDLEKQAVKLNHSLSEQGAEQRKRIAELRAERSALGETAAEKRRAKEIDKEINALLKETVDASDDELKKMAAQNREARARLKLLSQEARAYRNEQSIWKSLARITKDDNKSLKEKLKAVAQMAKGLKLSEEHWKRIGAAAKKAGSVALGVAKGAGGIALGVGGAAMALGGAAVASANSQVEREREARRIKGGGTLEDKNNLLGQLYIETGRDYSSIVDAINRVQTVLGGSLSHDELIRAASAELQMAGAAALFRQQNTGSVSASDFTRYANRMKAVQGATGASLEQVQSSSDYIANLRQSSFSNASETELQSLYLALQNSGAFDSDEELQRAFRGFVRHQKDSGKGVFELAREWQNAGTWNRYAYGATNKTQAANAIKNLNIGALESAARTDDATVSRTSAEETAMKMRQLEETKNQLLMKILQALEPIIKELDVKELQDIFALIVDAFKTVMPLIMDVMKAMKPYVKSVLEGLKRFLETEGVFERADAAVGVDDDSWFSAKSAAKRRQKVKEFFGFANGGVTSMPSICGEAGAEAVIPLSPERSGRASQIMQTVTQNFSMMSNETTTASLASMLRSNAFAFEAGRLGALTHRRGL